MSKLRIVKKSYNSMVAYFVQYLDYNDVWRNLNYIEPFDRYEKAIEFVEKTLLLEQPEVVMRVFD